MRSLGVYLSCRGGRKGGGWPRVGHIANGGYIGYYIDFGWI